MSRVTYHDVSFDMPEGWQDASIVSLLGPAPEPLSMMRVKKPPASDRPSVVMTRADARGLTYELEDYARAQERVLTEILDEVTILDRGELTVGSGEQAVPVVTREVSFVGPEGAVLRQAHAYLRLGDTMFTLTATGIHDAGFDAVRAHFRSIVESLRPA